MNPPPFIILAPRATDDSIRIWKAGIDAGWPVQRLPSWRVPAGFDPGDRQILIYAEPLFAEAVADQLAIILLEPPPIWLPELPHRFRNRHIYLSTLAEARLLAAPTFIKPAEGRSSNQAFASTESVSRQWEMWTKLYPFYAATLSPLPSRSAALSVIAKCIR